MSGSSLQYDFEAGLGGLGGSITLSDLFPHGWMDEHTDAETIGGFIEASGFEVNSAEAFYALPDEEWDDYVAAHSAFDGWGQMVARAVDAYLARVEELDRAGDPDRPAASDEDAER